MNSTDVIGWIVNNDWTYCPDCSPTNEEGDGSAIPIFAGSETDSFQHCATCEGLIPENLTSDGLDDALARMWDFLTLRSGRAEILVQWAGHLRNSNLDPGDAQLCSLTIDACDKEHIKACWRNVNNNAAGFKSLLEKAEECPACGSPTCKAIRQIKVMLNAN